MPEYVSKKWFWKISCFTSVSCSCLTKLLWHFKVEFIDFGYFLRWRFDVIGYSLQINIKRIQFITNNRFSCCNIRRYVTRAFMYWSCNNPELGLPLATHALWWVKDSRFNNESSDDQNGFNARNSLWPSQLQSQAVGVALQYKNTLKSNARKSISE